jgi:ribosomal protein S8E
MEEFKTEEWEQDWKEASDKKEEDDWDKSIREYEERKTEEKETPHAAMNWTACYEDHCEIHKSEKEGTGYWPKKPKQNKEKKVMFADRQPKVEDIEDEGGPSNTTNTNPHGTEETTEGGDKKPNFIDTDIADTEDDSIPPAFLLSVINISNHNALIAQQFKNELETSQQARNNLRAAIAHYINRVYELEEQLKDREGERQMWRDVTSTLLRRLEDRN